MNVVDYVIIGILGLSILVGLYRGFVSSVVSTGGCLISLGLSFWLSPKLVDLIKNDSGLINTLMSYTDASSRIGDVELAGSSIHNLSGDLIQNILGRVNLPPPLDQLLKVNLENQVYAPSGLNQVGDYVSQTIVSACLNVICFVVCFILLFLAVSILLNLLKAIFRFPVLKQLDTLVGGVFGLARGVLLCFIAFALIPLVETMLPVDNIKDLISQSVLAPLFNSGNLILAVMRGKL